METRVVADDMAPKQPSRLKSKVQADTFAGDLEKTHQTVRNRVQNAPACQMQYAGGKEVVFEVREKFLLSMGCF
jgi:hypothetical protein